MPELKTETRKASQVRKGDVVQDAGQPRVVTMTETKPRSKYTVVYHDAGSFKILTEAELPVGRTVATKAERLAAISNRVFVDAMQTLQGPRHTAAKIADEAERNYRADYVYSSLQNHLEALAQRDLAFMTLQLAGWHDDTFVTFADAIVMVADECERNLIENRFRGGSTSSMSNVTEETQRKVAAEFVRSYLVGNVRYEMRDDA